MLPSCPGTPSTNARHGGPTMPTRTNGGRGAAGGAEARSVNVSGVAPYATAAGLRSRRNGSLSIMRDVSRPSESAAIGRAGGDTGQIAGIGASVGREMRYQLRTADVSAITATAHAQRSSTMILIGRHQSPRVDARE